MRALATTLVCGVAALASACDEDAGVREIVVEGDVERDVERGVEIDFELDIASLALVDDGPFLDDEGAAIVPCQEGGVQRESGRVEVRTEWCDPADLATTLPVDVTAGTLAVIELSHDNLIADGGELHLAVVIGDGAAREVVWQRAQTLPRAADYVHEAIPLTRPHAAGERVVVHVHNHGANTYTLHGLRFRSP